MKFFLSLLFTAALFFMVMQPVYAQETEDVSVQIPTPTPIAYALPYPGLMPGQMLYPFKAARDRIMGFLISNPMKKAEFDLLHADKRIHASLLLIDQNKENVDAASEVFLKGENYFDEAVKKTADAKKQGMDTADIVKRLILANQKHQEVLQHIEMSVSEKSREKFKTQKQRLEEIKKSVNKLGK